MTTTKPAGHEDVPEDVKKLALEIADTWFDSSRFELRLNALAEQAILADRSSRAKAPAQSTELAPDVKGLVERLRKGREAITPAPGARYYHVPPTALELEAADALSRLAKPVAWSAAGMRQALVMLAAASRAVLNRLPLGVSIEPAGPTLTDRLDNITTEVEDALAIVLLDPQRAPEVVPEHRLFQDYFDLDAADAAMKASLDGQPLWETFAAYKAGPLEANALLKWYAWHVRVDPLSRLSAPPAEAKPVAWRYRSSYYNRWEFWPVDRWSATEFATYREAHPEAEPLYDHPDPRAKAAEAVPEGMVLVPREPTLSMVVEGNNENRSEDGSFGDTARRVWAAMLLAAAPQPLSTGEVK